MAEIKTIDNIDYLILDIDEDEDVICYIKYVVPLHNSYINKYGESRDIFYNFRAHEATNNNWLADKHFEDYVFEIYLETLNTSPNEACFESSGYAIPCNSIRDGNINGIVPSASDFYSTIDSAIERIIYYSDSDSAASEDEDLEAYEDGEFIEVDITTEAMPKLKVILEQLEEKH